MTSVPGLLCRLQQVGQPWNGIPHIKHAVKRVSLPPQPPDIDRSLACHACPVTLLIECWLPAVLSVRQWAVQISKDCRDLLDRIFVIDEKKRISIHDIKAHDWYNRALPARYQHAELDLVEQQKELEAHLSTRELDQASPSPRPLGRPVWLLNMTGSLPASAVPLLVLRGELCWRCRRRSGRGTRSCRR